MNWKIKGLVQGALSCVPGGMQANSFLQRTVGNLSNLNHNVDVKVTCDWLVLLSHMWEVNLPPQKLRYVEIGTGWYPTLPVCYYLIGAASCRTYDINRHLSGPLTWKMLRRLEHHLPAIAEGGRVSTTTVYERYAALLKCSTIEELLELAHIQYLAPGDAAHTDLRDGSVDVVFSNSVLEHVPKEAIFRLMKESFRILEAGGHVIHSANCGDHYAYSDRSITAVNYFRYSEQEWRIWNNPLQYQNRLRPNDFIAIATEAGLDILLSKHQPQQRLLDALQHMAIAPEFRTYDLEQLAMTSVDFVARKPDRRNGSGSFF